MMSKNVIYLSGRITGNDHFREQFAEAKGKYSEDFEVINPAEVVLPSCCTHEDYMVICFHLLDKADYIVMLDGWEQSKGACMEYGYATARGITIL